MTRPSPRVCSIAAMLAALSGCVLNDPPTGDELHREAFRETMVPPEAWTAGASAGEVESGWIHAFNDERLTELVHEAILHNTDLRVTAMRVEQAAANVRIAGGSIYPTVDFLGRASAEDGDGNSPIDGGFLTASWEIDLWGRVRYGKRSAEDAYAATAADFVYAQQSVAAMVVRSWLLASEATLQRRLAVDTLTGAERLVALTDDRQRVGIGSELELAQARASAHTYRDIVRQLDLGIAQAMRSIEILLGRYPAAELAAATEFPSVRGDAPAGLPSELLERRPDVIAAERRVAAAFARTGQAKAARLPRFSLNGSGSSIESDILVLQERDNPIWGLGLGVVMPLFQGGALKAQVELRTAEQRAAVAQYATTGLKAFGEVENALASERAAFDRLAILEAQTRDYERALELENTRYRVGNTDLRSVTQQQVALYAARSALLRVQAERLTQRVNLYLALGGGFESS